MAASNTINHIDLGFAEEQDSWLLTNRYFPSKIGGKIALLGKENIKLLTLNTFYSPLFRFRKHPRIKGFSM